MLEDIRGSPEFKETILSPSRDGAEDLVRRLVVLELRCDWAGFEPAAPSWYAEWARRVAIRVRDRITRLGVGRASHEYFSVRHDPSWTRQQMDRLGRLRPRTFCIKDEAYHRFEADDGTIWEAGMALEPNSRKMRLATLESLFGERSRFERERPPLR